MNFFLPTFYYQGICSPYTYTKVQCLSCILIFLMSVLYQVYVTVQFSSVTQSCPTLCHGLHTPWTAAHQASLSITNSQSLLKLVSITMESVMPSNHLIICRPLLLPPSILPSIRIFSSESILHIRWPNY